MRVVLDFLGAFVAPLVCAFAFVLVVMWLVSLVYDWLDKR